MPGNIGLLAPSVWTTMMTTELNSLGANTGVLQSTGTNAAFDNGQALGTGLFPYADFELSATFGVAPTAGQTVDCYLIPLASAGGTTYTDGSASIQQSSLYIGSWTLRAITTLQLLTFRYQGPMPPRKFILSILSNSGQAMAASGNTIKMYPYGNSYS